MITLDNGRENEPIEISIVVLTYFHEKFIARALDTIINQTFQGKCEIIVSDDYSQDYTVEIIKKYQKQYPNLIKPIYNQTNLGICRNEYNALMKCSGKYIIMTAGDDRWSDNNKLLKQYTFLEKHSEYIAECTLLEFEYTDGTKIDKVGPEQKYWNREFFKEEYYNRNFFSSSGMMFRNIFQSNSMREKFRILYEFSRDIDDLTFGFLILECGKIHISDYISYCITVRKSSDSNQHNYNSKYKGISNSVNHLLLINRIDKYYNHEICLKRWYEPYFSELLYYGICMHKWNAFQYMHLVPVRYMLGYLLNILKNKRKQS